MTPGLTPASAGPSALRATGLAVGYGSRRSRRAVLEGLDLQVRAGELVCLLGPNGIGKSTLLRTLARLQPPLDGAIAIGGADLRSLTPLALARRLGVVLTDRVAVGGLTARRVVEIGRYPHVGVFGRLGEHDHDAVERAIDAVGATDIASRHVATLSDGERQRVMIARALAQEPMVLLLDEPTAFLDVASRVELMGLLRRVAHRQRLAVVVSTHDLELALRTADTVWLVTPGGGLSAGAPEDVILSGEVARAFERGGVRFVAGERTFRVPSGQHGRAVVHGEGLYATLARAVLEREGFEIADAAHDALVTVIIDPSGDAWIASTRDGTWRGRTFAELASSVRLEAPHVDPSASVLRADDRATAGGSRISGVL